MGTSNRRPSRCVLCQKPFTRLAVVNALFARQGLAQLCLLCQLGFCHPCPQARVAVAGWWGIAKRGDVARSFVCVMAALGFCPMCSHISRTGRHQPPGNTF